MTRGPAPTAVTDAPTAVENVAAREAHSAARLAALMGPSWIVQVAGVAGRFGRDAAHTLDAIVYDFAVHGYRGTTHRRRIAHVGVMGGEEAKVHLRKAGLAAFVNFRGAMPCLAMRLALVTATPTDVVDLRHHDNRDLILKDLRAHPDAATDAHYLPWWLWTLVPTAAFTNCVELAASSPNPAAATLLLSSTDPLESLDEARVFTHTVHQ